jgi:hypothetical protein
MGGEPGPEVLLEHGSQSGLEQRPLFGDLGFFAIFC